MDDHDLPAWGDPATLVHHQQHHPDHEHYSHHHHSHSLPSSPTSAAAQGTSAAATSSSLSSSCPSTPNVGNQPQVVEYEQSFGFVEVGEGELEGGGYKLKRNASTVVLTGDGLAQHQRQIESLERGMDDLRVEFERLKLQVLEFEEENHQWSLRYSRRMAVVANASLGTWIFWSRFILFVKRHKADLIQGWLRSSSSSSSSPLSSMSSPSAVATRAAAPLLRRTKESLVRQAIIGGGGGRAGKRATFNKLFTKGYVFAIRHSWVFLLSSYLITRKGFRRWAGLIASTCYSVYLAFFTDTVPWTSYFTIFANLLYITACLKGMNDGEKEVPSLFNLHKGGGREPASASSSAQAATSGGSGLGGSGSAPGGPTMARNDSFVSRHTRNPSRSGRKISTPTPLSAFASASPTPSFSSPTTSFSSPSQSRQLAMAFSSSSSSSPTPSPLLMGHATVAGEPSFPSTRMRKNRSNVHFVLDEDDDNADADAANNRPTDTFDSPA